MKPPLFCCNRFPPGLTVTELQKTSGLVFSVVTITIDQQSAGDYYMLSSLSLLRQIFSFTEYIKENIIILEYKIKNYLFVCYAAARSPF